MVATAKIVVNSGSGGVNPTTDGKTGTEMLKELKNIGFSLKKMFSTGASGVASMFGAGGAARGLAGVGGAAAGAAGLLGAVVASPGSEPQKYQYEEALVEGEEKVLKINALTGEIIDVLTQQEARDQGILDEKDNIVGYLQVSNKIYKDSVKGLEYSKEKIMMSVEDLATISDLQGREKEIQRAINEALSRKLSKLGGDTSKYPTSGPTNSYDSSTGVGFSSAGQGYSAAAQNGWTQEQERNKQEFLQKFTDNAYGIPLQSFSRGLDQ